MISKLYNVNTIKNNFLIVMKFNLTVFLRPQCLVNELRQCQKLIVLCGYLVIVMWRSNCVCFTCQVTL